VRHAGRFCVNILSAEQEEISKRFVGKRPMEEKFAELAWTLQHDTPVLEHCLTAIVCDVVEEVEAGDHAIIIGSPVHMELRDDLHPLVFYRGAYWERIAERAESGVQPSGEFRLSPPAG
jgi:flavin reductase (DIM6/NTAB) family NADH-FMN oxidoreductase RutF